MIYILCDRPSDSAILLRDWLRANGLQARKVRRPREEGLLVNWGAAYAGVPPENTLNASLCHSKLSELQALQRGSVAIPQFWTSAPQASSIRQVSCSHVCAHGHAELSRVQSVPAPPFLVRCPKHGEARDLLSSDPNTYCSRNGHSHQPYYVEKLGFRDEWRVHVFKDKSIRAGKKVEVTDSPPGAHSWIRSMSCGWRISYGAERPPSAVRELAKAAVRALSYDFGAVDIGVKQDGTPVVLEVNSAPGLGGGTVEKYGEAIKTYYEAL